MFNRRELWLALAGLLAVLMLFVNLGGPRLWDRDEPRNAGCAREMLDRNDWIVPVFNSELRSHKPVLLYWCIMAAYRLLGVSEFAARLPSALAAVASALCTFAIGRRFWGAAAGVWAAIALSTSLLFVMAGRAATPDSLLIACMTLALTIYVLGTFPRVATGAAGAAPLRLTCWFPQRTTTVVAMYAAMGLAVLAKGPIGVLLPCAMIGLFLLIMRLPDDTRQPMNSAQRVRIILRPFGLRHFLATFWSMRPLTLIAVVTVVALPWYWAVGAATHGRFLREFLWGHNFHRATNVMEGHDGNILFYPLAILVGFFPWSVLAAPLVLDLREQVRRGKTSHPAHVLAWCWIGVYVVFFSLSRTKLPSYITPCFPALALLTGSYMSRWERSAYSGRWLQVGFGCYAVVGLALAAIIPFVSHRYLPGEEWLGVIGLSPLIGGGLCLVLVAKQNLRRAAIVFACSAVSFTTLIFSVGAQRVDRQQHSHRLLAAIRAHATDPHIASYQILEPSWVFYSGHSITELPRPRTGPKRAGAGQESPASDVVRFLETEPSGFVILRQEAARELTALLPPDVKVLAEANRFLSTQRLVVLGRPRIPGEYESRPHVRQAALD
jgi:4-amino-4-deoxy-L-arabinose transferase-like glycosyltransferase